jgi:Ca2+-binding RTX toxin-like protein
MRWHRYLTLAALLGAAATALPGGATAATQANVTARVVNGTLVVTGTAGPDTIRVGLQPGDPNTVLVTDGLGRSLPFDRSLFTAIVVNAGDGADSVSIDQSGGAFTDTEATTLNGQGGDDTLTGGSFTETLNGGPGNDTIDGGFGNDVITLGTGNDTDVWNPGGSSDVVDGNSGSDTLLFNGSNANERIDLSANGGRVRLTRDVAAVTLDLGGFETIDVGVLGGTDVVTVNDLAGTGAKAVNVDLGTPFGPDGAVDQVVVNGTASADHIHLGTASGHVQVTGLAVPVSVANPEPTDVVGVNGLGGDDRVTVDTAVYSLMDGAIDGGEGVDTTDVQGTDAADTIGIAPNGTQAAVFGNGPSFVGSIAENLLVEGLGGDDQIVGQNGLAGLTSLTIDGGAGNDTIRGGDGDDRVLGGDGNDSVDAGRGNDTVDMGAGDDTFEWDPGDGSDSIEGSTGADTLQFNGSNIGEHVELSKNGSHLRFTRDVALIALDVHGVEAVRFAALGGADVVTVDDLTGTGVTSVLADLSGFGGVGDGGADSVVVNATNHTDLLTVTGSAGSATVAGLAATVTVTGAESPVDGLSVNALGSDDVVDASALAADAIRLSLDGGAGRDVLRGGAGDDFISGGPGRDQISCGPGNDTVVPDPLDTFAADCEA